MRSHEFIAESNTDLLSKLEIDPDNEGYSIGIPVNVDFRLEDDYVPIDSLGMYISFDPRRGSSDLAAFFDPDEYNEEEKGYLYGSRVFEKELRKFLVRIGFPAEVVGDIWFSESGMQDEGRASFDAQELEEYLRGLILDKLNQSDPARVTEIIKHVPSVVLYLSEINPQAAEAAKTEIIKYCLEQFKKNQAQNAMSIVDKLKDVGINWPEFAAMEKSAGALTK